MFREYARRATGYVKADGARVGLNLSSFRAFFEEEENDDSLPPAAARLPRKSPLETPARRAASPYQVDSTVLLGLRDADLQAARGAQLETLIAAARAAPLMADACRHLRESEGRWARLDAVYVDRGGTRRLACNLRVLMRTSKVRLVQRDARRPPVPPPASPSPPTRPPVPPLRPTPTWRDWRKAYFSSCCAGRTLRMRPRVRPRPAGTALRKAPPGVRRKPTRPSPQRRGAA